MPDYRLTITLNEPFTCSSHPVISNEIQTLDFIPGTVLRGSLAATLSYLGRQNDLAPWFGTSGPRWTSALPLPDSAAETIVPMPFCFAADKKDIPFRGRYHTLNNLLVTTPGSASEYSALTGHTLDHHHHFQWTGVRTPWLRVVNGKPVEGARVPLDSSMHVGLHYGRQSARTGALFSRREIPAGTRFEAWVHDPLGTLRQIPDFLFLGKRRSAGNGSAQLKAEPAPIPWTAPPTLQPGQTEVAIQLMADALVPDPATGSWLRGLDSAFWQRTLNLDVTVIASASANRPVLGWSTRWDLPRSQALAIAAGSVYRVKAIDAVLLSAALARLAAAGIGIRRHEGFGLVAVDPPWLQYPVNGVIGSPPDPAITAKPQPWPGLESQPRAKILEIAHQAGIAARDLIRRRSDRKDLTPQLAALSAYAGRVQDPAEVLAFARSFVARANPRSWDVLIPILEPLLEKAAAHIAQTRFALDAVETLLKD